MRPTLPQNLLPFDIKNLASSALDVAKSCNSPVDLLADLPILFQLLDLSYKQFMVVTDKCNSLVLWTLSISALSQIASEAVTIYFPIIFSVVTDCIFRLLHQPSQFIVDLKTFSSVKNKTKRSLYLIIETLYYL